ncbi:hypothetical protein SAMN02745883_00669 [Caminicella sporogenes DSM 14501]|uniref:Uncharacterized protein n=1 Tax=Caminicella sporogenes DSM 14501 TaxID=1121266 RepID=A0A1M6MW59_9FIRM|nr:hypothetical protein [Caminicella sporogenes]RKD22475.1 hypothetical protein BET04_05430 [Caminicella sporogenes]SHJ87656.1 hypothetical protein SAMN02745883_00669 [Caminicella sporogenes DSM 14501]
MSQVIPLKMKQQLKNNLASNIASNITKNSKRKNFYRNFSPNSFILNPKTLLPILFIFKYGKKGSGLAFFQDILSPSGSIGNIFSNLNFSPDKIEKSLNALNIISQFSLSKNSTFFNTFSAILDGLYKFSAIQSLTKNLSKNSNNQEFDDILKHATNQNDTETTFKAIETFEKLMGNNSKFDTQRVKEIINAANKFKNINKTKEFDKKNNLDIAEVINILKPILPKEYAKSLDSIFSIIKLMDLLSFLESADSSDNDKNSNINSNKNELNSKKIIDLMSSFSDKSRDFEKENVIDIEDYDEEINLDDKYFKEIEFEMTDNKPENEKIIDIDSSKDTETVEINLNELESKTNETAPENLETLEEDNNIKDDFNQADSNNNDINNTKNTDTTDNHDETVTDDSINYENNLEKNIDLKNSLEQTITNTNEKIDIIKKENSEENTTNEETPDNNEKILAKETFNNDYDIEDNKAKKNDTFEG